MYGLTGKCGGASGYTDERDGCVEAEHFMPDCVEVGTFAGEEGDIDGAGGGAGASGLGADGGEERG